MNMGKGELRGNIYLLWKRRKNLLKETIPHETRTKQENIR